MRAMPYLQIVSGKYWVRIVVPPELGRLPAAPHRQGQSDASAGHRK